MLGSRPLAFAAPLTPTRLSAFPLFGFLLSTPAAAQVVHVGAPGNISSGLPGNNSFSEQVDLADVDLEGAWDAAFANGGDCCNDQNRPWINLGGICP